MDAPVHQYRGRVLRDKRYKRYIGTDRKAEKLIGLASDPDESKNLLASEAPEHKRRPNGAYCRVLVFITVPAVCA
jgi:hypothetical protein